MMALRTSVAPLLLLALSQACLAAPSAEAPAAAITAPTPAPETWTCSKCKHVYDASKDDPAKKNTPFEQLPASWKCPVCGAPKSAYVKSVNEAGEVEWPAPNVCDPGASGAHQGLL